MLFSFFYDAKLREKNVRKKTCSKVFAVKNCKMAQEGLGWFCMEIIAYKDRPISFFIDEIYLILHCPTTVAEQPT